MQQAVDISIPSPRLLDLVSELTDAERRPETARALAQRLGAEDMLIFVEDPEVHMLLPAPGFPQTLPQGRTWRAFVRECVAAGYHTGDLPFPDAHTVQPAVGLTAKDGSVLILLGGTPNRDKIDEICLLLPLIAAAFRGERAAEVAQGHAATARQSAAQTKLLADSLDKARRDLQRALHIRDQFLTIAAHELKTPLTSLLGYCQVLQRRIAREGGVNERNQAALSSIYAQTRRLHNMINQLFDLARTQTTAIAVERKPVDLALLVRKLIAELQPTLERHKVDLDTEESLIVLGDEMRLEQVLQNLLDNAVKYSPRGGVITVRVMRRDSAGCISIGDQGIGIPEDAKSELFSRYYRASNVNPRNISGLGIGLYLVDQIVTSHGGKIELASEVGKGSTFTVCLPLLHEDYKDNGEAGHTS